MEGYTSDISRTFVLGKATDKMKQVFDIVHRAQSAALRRRGPALPLRGGGRGRAQSDCGRGLGPGYKYFSHRVGHGMGMDGHEWPYFVRNNMFGYQLSPI